MLIPLALCSGSSMGSQSAVRLELRRVILGLGRRAVLSMETNRLRFSEPSLETDLLRSVALARCSKIVRCRGCSLASVACPSRRYLLSVLTNLMLGLANTRLGPLVSRSGELRKPPTASATSRISWWCAPKKIERNASEDNGDAEHGFKGPLD